MTTDPREEELHVHLAVDDARTAHAAGARFARALAGAHADDFALALVEQEHLIQRAIMDAGHGTERAGLTAREFAAAAAVEWQRLTDAGAGTSRGTA